MRFAVLQFFKGRFFPGLDYGKADRLVTAVELGEQFRQDIQPGGGTAGISNVYPASHLAQPGAKGFFEQKSLGYQGARRFHQAATGLGQFDARAVPVEKLDLVGVFQAADMLADAGLGQFKFFRRRRKTAPLPGRDKDHKLVKIYHKILPNILFRITVNLDRPF